MESLQVKYFNISVFSYSGCLLYIVLQPRDDSSAVACAVTRALSMPRSLELKDGSVNVTCPVGKSGEQVSTLSACYHWGENWLLQQSVAHMQHIASGCITYSHFSRRHAYVRNGCIVSVRDPDYSSLNVQM